MYLAVALDEMSCNRAEFGRGRKVKMQQADIDLWKLGITGAGLLATFITVMIAVLKERHASRERLREEFRFSVEVDKVRKEQGELSRLSEQKAINALLGRRDIPVAVGRYLVEGFADAELAVRAYRASRGRLELENGPQPVFRFKGFSRSRRYRQVGKLVGFVGYFISCLYATSPLMFALLGVITDGQARQLLPMTLFTGVLVAIPILLWGASFARAEKFMSLQDQAISAGSAAARRLSA